MDETELRDIAPEGTRVNSSEGRDDKLSTQAIIKVVAASISFFFAGNNDGSLGALIPYILRTYNVGTDKVALM